ncbi:MAG: DUF4445 domain-containing protein [Phycisphaerales bacterium]|nr:MAG: DUF4445 domain-containing protein [Phycisphaerales bacterium]
MGERKKKKCRVHFGPSGLKIEVERGTTLLDAAHKAGLYLSSICGGDGYCGKCKVVIDEGQFQTRPTGLLTPDELRDNVVLACQTRVLSDLTVTVPHSHALETSSILIDSDAHRFSELAADERPAVFEFDPLVQKLNLEMTPPSVQDHTADHERLYAAIREKIEAPIMQTGFRVLQKLSPLLQRADYQATVTVGRRGGTTEVIEIEEGNCAGRNFAVAVDLGTTTVVAHLVDLTTATTIDTEATYNSQINFGEDYIRRIIYAEENDAFSEMQNRIVKDINSLTVTLALRQKVDLQEITTVVCAGNTAMLHFLLNLDARRIRREPYVASASFVPPIRAAEVGVQINKRGLLYCLPNVAAYVGSDVVGGVLATGVFARPGITLFADIGTNGEIVLGGSDWLVCASSSAGPAFEGSGVKHGMRAARGAIEKFSFGEDSRIHYETISGAPAVGLCGSGLLDVLAECHAHGIIDRTGRFVAASDPRLTEGEEGRQFQIVPPRDGHQEIAITQADIDNLLRSKAGVFAAIRVLMEATQTRAEDLDAVYLAGGFGNFLDVRQAVAIGMLPDVPVEKIRFVGNTAIAGAKMALLSREALDRAEQIAGTMTYFDLMSYPGYMEEFIRAKFLPHTDLSLFPSVAAAPAGRRQHEPVAIVESRRPQRPAEREERTQIGRV